MSHRRDALALAVALTVMPGQALSADENPSDRRRVEYVDVSESVVVARHDYGANITCFALEEGLVFVDTGMSTELAAQVREDLERRFGRGTRALLLSHAHLDHILGMGAFADVEVIAAAAARELFEEQLAIEFTEERIAAWTSVFGNFGEAIQTAQPFLPKRWLENEISLGSGDDTLVFANTGGHSAGSSYAFHTREGVVAAGDLVQVDQYVYFGDPTTDLQKWMDTLAAWEEMDVKKVCPGHGRVVGPDYLPQVRGFFEQLIATLEDLKVKGVPIEEVATHPSLPVGYWGDVSPRPGWYDYCVTSIYKQL